MLGEGQTTEIEQGIRDASASRHTICKLVFIETHQFNECGS